MIKPILLIIGLLPVLCVAEPVLVLNTTGKPPLNSLDGSGFLDQLTETALSRIGYRLERVQLPAERGLVNANRGINDGEMSRIAGLEKIYKNLSCVPEKIMDWEFVVFTKKGISLIDGWDSLAKKNVAFINGWKIIEKNIPSSTKIIKVKNETQLFLLLEKDRTDYIIYEKWGGLEIMRKNNYHELKLLGKPLAVREMYIYLNKKHESIVEALANALRLMKEDGSYSELENKILHTGNY